MIKIADKTNTLRVRQMWKTCFDDSEEFMDIYFSEKYLNENTLIYFEKNCPVASLQMLPYLFKFYGIEIPVSYISGACTLPEFRNKGYMEKLLIESFNVMKDRNIPMSLLIPAENRLCSYYEKYGFETVFDEGADCILLKNILDEAVIDFDEAYSHFSSLFKEKDFCIQKSKTDFQTIVKDAKLNKTPPKNNLSGMARLIDVEMLLNIFAAKNSDKSFALEMKDKFFPYNNANYIIENGICRKTKSKSNKYKTINVNVLCRLLFGYHLEQLPIGSVTSHFNTQEAVLNLMLE